MTQTITYALLEWYDQNQRVLPWRTERTPYRTLVSEVMLQQTRVDTVIPYFESFMETFPTIESLAAANQDAVMAKWSGLGYYSRARNLHKAANQIVDLGYFPNTLPEIRNLSGVGEYIAGAIGSMAFQLDVAAVDGNLHRVLSRLFCDSGDRNAMWVIADSLLPKGTGRCGDFNQALMDLGSSHCAKVSNCMSCPIQQYCQAYQTGRVADFPVLPKKKKKREIQYWSLVIPDPDDPNSLWLGQRPNDGLYGGMVEPWLIEIPENSTSLASSFLNQMQQYDSAFWADVTVEQCQSHGELTHILTHIRMSIFPIELKISLEQKSCISTIVATIGGNYVQSNWYSKDEMTQVGISSLTEKILAFRQSYSGQLSLF